MVNAKMKAICDNIRLRTGGTTPLNLDEIAAAILTIGGNFDIADWVHNSVGAAFPPAQLPADDVFDGYDIDILDSTSDDLYSYIDEVVNNYPKYATKEVLGKESSGRYDLVRYTLANRQYYAWCKQNYPKMYAWKDNSVGETVPAFTNIKDQCVFKYNTRFSMSGGGYKTHNGLTTVLVPVPSGSTSVVIRFKNVSISTNYTAVYGGASVDSLTEQCQPSDYGISATNPWNVDSNGVHTLTCPKSATTTYVSFHMDATSADDFVDTIITVNEPIEYTTVGGGTMYSTSVSPRIGEKMYSTPYIDNHRYITEIVSAQAALVEGYRWSGSGKNFTAVDTAATLIVPIQGIIAPFDVELVGMTVNRNYNGIYGTTDVGGTPPNDSPYGTGGTGATTVSVVKEGAALFFAVNRTAAAGEYNNAKIKINGNEIDVVISSTTNYQSNIKQMSTTITEVEGDNGKPISAVSATRRSRTVEGIEYFRFETDDVEPTVIYTDITDERNTETTITQDGVSYNRYPLGDLGVNRKKLTPIFIFANEHGVELAGLDSSSDRYQKHESKMCALIAARFVRDLCTGTNAGSALYKYIRENCMVIVIPVVNPFGFNMNVTGITNSSSNGYMNSNNCNINRNYDCPGWDVMNPSGNSSLFGKYPGSENETQYVMNTMVESGAVVAMSLHSIGGWSGYSAHQGQDPDGTDYNQEKLEKVKSFLKNTYGYTLRYYDLKSDGTPDAAINTPDITCKSPSYITQCGAYGGIIEFQPDDMYTSGFLQEMKSNVLEHAYAQMLNLTAMWLSDYLEVVGE